MQVSKIIADNSLKLLSGLANNNDSISSMVVKDLISDCAIVHTYKKEGGKDDARERAIEEFGTGAVWLFGIPIIKKAFDKIVYPIFKLDSKFDIRVLKDENLANIKDTLKNSSNKALDSEKAIFSSLDNFNPVLKKVKNKDLYMGLFGAKFLMATAISAIALSKIIKYKQKTTQKRIEDEHKQNSASRVLLAGNVKKQPVYNKFNNSPSFTGAGAFFADFMFNPIKNTAILDGVITGTRLIEAREGERKEVALKEGFQLLFIYALAKPIQKAFEFVGSKLNLPIELDPKLLFSKDLKDELKRADSDIKELKSSKDAVKSIYQKDVKSPVIALLDKAGAINTIKENGEIKALSYIKPNDSKKIAQTLSNMETLNKNISNLSKIKAFKVFAVLANVALAAWAMGVLQPKINIFMRKKLNNGDNRNPAIIAQENKLKEGA